MSDVSPDENHQTPLTRPGFIVSAALILVLIAAVIVIAFIPRGGDEPDARSNEPTTSETTSAPAATAAGVEESVCGLPASDDTALGAAPESNWELVGTMAVPEAPETAGPGVVDDRGFRTCFAHSPTGALYAAANLLGQGSIGDEETQRKLLEQLTIESAGQQTALENISEAGSAPSVQISGFQLLSYSDSAATVDIAFTLEGGAVGHVSLPLRWADGDWKIEVADDGQFLNDPVQLNDLSDYIPWSGV
ncbi:hypothetical protein [Arthrobacter sp. CAN_A1]|uniref:hypothetical protein n=1 Tax=Arthrobacter sp. CAN_A1 TaxID=2787717 RepID=UPI0018CA27C2